MTAEVTETGNLHQNEDGMMERHEVQFKWLSRSAVALKPPKLVPLPAPAATSHSRDFHELWADACLWNYQF